MKLAITGSEVNGDSHIDIPASFEVVNEAGLLGNLKRLEND